jgi:hypothetical protein
MAHAISPMPLVGTSSAAADTILATLVAVLQWKSGVEDKPQQMIVAEPARTQYYIATGRCSCSPHSWALPNTVNARPTAGPSSSHTGTGPWQQGHMPCLPECPSSLSFIGLCRR